MYVSFLWLVGCNCKLGVDPAEAVVGGDTADDGRLLGRGTMGPEPRAAFRVDRRVRGIVLLRNK